MIQNGEDRRLIGEFKFGHIDFRYPASLYRRGSKLFFSALPDSDRRNGDRQKDKTLRCLFPGSVMDRSKALSEKKLLWTIRLLDMAIPALVAWVAIVAWLPEHFEAFDSQYILAMAASALLVGNVFAALDLYSIRTLS